MPPTPPWCGAIAKVFAEIRRNKSISLIVRTSWRVREVESYALSKFQPPTTLGDPLIVEKTIRKKFDFLGYRKSVLFFLDFGGARQFQKSKSVSSWNFAPDTPILRSVRLKIGKIIFQHLCCENLASASHLGVYVLLIGCVCWPSPY